MKTAKCSSILDLFIQVINENFQFEVFYILTLYMKSYLEMNRRPLEDKLKQLKNQLSRN
jgi:hypothetical protein